jgi:hypothetical protein
MIAGLRTQLESSRKQLLEAIQGFTQEKSHVRPDDESWCAAEVLRHLLGSEHRMRERAPGPRAAQYFATGALRGRTASGGRNGSPGNDEPPR